MEPSIDKAHPWWAPRVPVPLATLKATTRRSVRVSRAAQSILCRHSCRQGVLHKHRQMVYPLPTSSDGAHRFTSRTIATKLISDLPARGNPRVRLARDQCFPRGPS